MDEMRFQNKVKMTPQEFEELALKISTNLK